MDTALLLFLILINGWFAMSEMALTASRKARLQVMVEAGEHGASAALALHDNPTKFLSTIQIGITSIGVLNGIVGEAAFAGPLSEWLEASFPLFTERGANLTATGLVVVIVRPWLALIVIPVLIAFWVLGPRLATKSDPTVLRRRFKKKPPR